MDELRLAIPDESLLDEIAAYRQAMLDADSSMDGCGPLKRMENPAEWLAFCRQLDDPATTPPHWVPMTQFVCLRGAKIAGMIQVRRELNDFLREYAGHIGYSVRVQAAAGYGGVDAAQRADVLPRNRLKAGDGRL